MATVIKKKALLCLLRCFDPLAPLAFPHSAVGPALVDLLEQCPDLVCDRLCARRCIGSASARSQRSAGFVLLLL